MKNKRFLSAFKQILLTLTLICAALAAPAQSWTNRYTSRPGTDALPRAVAVDGAGNVIVTGFSGYSGNNDSDYATIQYSNAGMPLWTNIYNGPGNGPDQANALAVDTSGNVIVTGFAATTSNDSFGDYATIKYSSAGVSLWTNRYDGPAHKRDVGLAVAVDDVGNVFVAGHSEINSSGGYDFVTIKYSSGGLALWTNRHGGAVANSRCSLGVDGLGNVVVSGTADGLIGGDYGDYTTIKYAGNGAPLWTNFYGASASSTDRVESMALDPNGNVFVTGHTVESDFDMVTVAYSSAGVPLWTNRFNGSANGEDAPAGVAVDSKGDVIVAGYSKTGSSIDYATIKYSGAGLPLWTNYYNGPANGDELANALAVDGSGNVFVTGYSFGAGVNYETIAYSNAGLPLWTNLYSPGSATAIAVDGSGNVFVTGAQVVTANTEIVTIKYAAPPRLNALRAAGSIVLSWPDPEFVLQSAVGVAGPFTNILGVVSPFTNAISGERRFFQLKK